MAPVLGNDSQRGTLQGLGIGRVEIAAQCASSHLNYSHVSCLLGLQSSTTLDETLKEFDFLLRKAIWKSENRETCRVAHV